MIEDPSAVRIAAEVEGEAWITGQHEFLIDENDPLRHGFRL